MGTIRQQPDDILPEVVVKAAVSDGLVRSLRAGLRGSWRNIILRNLGYIKARRSSFGENLQCLTYQLLHPF